MRKYDNYKSSGIEWLGDIPQNWELNRIKNIGSVKGRVGWKALKASEYVDSGYFFLSTPNIKNTEIDYKNVNYITSERYFESPEIMLKNGDILLVKDGSTLGIVNIVKHLPSEGTVNSSIAVLSFKKVINEYVYFLLLSEYVQNEIQLKKDGMGVPHLFQKDINNFILLLPTLSEQTAIAQYLDTKTQAIEKKINLLTQKAATYKELRKSIINDAVCKGLDKNVKLKESGIEWIGEIPEHWEVRRLKDVGQGIIGLTYSPTDIVDEKDGGILVLRSSNIQNDKIDFSNNVFVKVRPNRNLIVRKGDILICSRNGSRALIGKNICIDDSSAGYTFGAFMTIFRTKYFGYVSYYFKSQLFDYQSGAFMTSTINQLTINTLNNLIIPVPSSFEQTAIANYLDDKTQKIDAIVSNIGKQIETLKELRKTLINDVVTGKIKVTNN